MSHSLNTGFALHIGFWKAESPRTHLHSRIRAGELSQPTWIQADLNTASANGCQASNYKVSTVTADLRIDSGKVLNPVPCGHIVGAAKCLLNNTLDK